jgi:hypothetical protein
VTYRPVARQHNSIAEEVFSVWSALRLFAQQWSGNAPTTIGQDSVFHGV